MNTNSDCKNSTLPPGCYHQRMDEGGVKNLSLSRRAELASDAFVAGGIIRLINNIVSKYGKIEATRLSLIDGGIELARQLRKGDVYLNQRRAHLMQQPESADTVKYIRAYGTSNVEERTEEALSVLACIRQSLIQGRAVDLADLNPGALESTRAFFRIVHTSIMDQLGASEIPSQPVHVD